MEIDHKHTHTVCIQHFYNLFTNDNRGEDQNFEVLSERFDIVRAHRVMQTSEIGTLQVI
jgi:hypothetical protein